MVLGLRTSLFGIKRIFMPQILKMIQDNKKFKFDFDKFKTLGILSKYTQTQVDSINLILEECAKQEVTDKNQVAYILATAWHESYLEPIGEYGSDKYLSKYDTGRLAKQLGNTPEADGDGQFYKGRGYVMITGRANYEKFSKLLEIDLINNPDLALEPRYAAFIIVYGMKHGSFTGSKLSFHINDEEIDFKNARKIVNGLDKADLIKSYAQKFLTVLN